METEARPWGSFTVLDDNPNWKIKRIEVLPGKRLSLQSHKHRDEVWRVLAGTGTFFRHNDLPRVCDVGSQFEICAGTKHRMANNHSELLVVLEIQTGTYFGEDDIVRYEDDFGRVGENEQAK